jgi:predicted GNAT family acetyltransferase
MAVPRLGTAETASAPGYPAYVEPVVTDNPGQMRYEIALDGEVVGFTQYRRSNLEGPIAFVHTEIEPGHEGEGLGSRLVSAALDDARDKGLAVVPLCPFVRSYIAEHAEYADLVPADRREEFGL